MISIWCMLCYKTVAVDHSGIGQVYQHATCGSHSLKSKTRFSSDQSKFEKIGNNIKFCSKPLQTRYMEAECLWAFKVAKQDRSFHSCDNINSLFYHVFVLGFQEVFSRSYKNVLHCLIWFK